MNRLYTFGLSLLISVLIFAVVYYWLTGIGYDDALNDVRSNNKDTINDAIQGFVDGESCHANGGVWKPVSGGGGECVPIEP